MNIRIGTITQNGTDIRGQEYLRPSFDAQLWNRMSSGDRLVLPRTARVPDDLGSHMSASFGANRVLTKLSNEVTGNIVGVAFDKL